MKFELKKKKSNAKVSLFFKKTVREGPLSIVMTV